MQRHKNKRFEQKNKAVKSNWLYQWLKQVKAYICDFSFSVIGSMFSCFYLTKRLIPSPIGINLQQVFFQFC